MLDPNQIHIGLRAQSKRQKEIGLESERYLITGFGKIAVLTFCAPAVVQAADLWKLIAGSFCW
jgi:hypothetical protein